MHINGITVFSGDIKDLRVPAVEETVETQENRLVVRSYTDEQGNTSPRLSVNTTVSPSSGIPEFWMFTGLDLASQPMYPVYSDSSSGGQTRPIFNFGQDPFLGDPGNYSPFDPNFDSSLWRVGNYNTTEKSISFGNLSTSAYEKTHTSGKYYFEVTLLGNPHADMLGLSNKWSSSRHLGRISATTVYVSVIGTYRDYIAKVFRKNGSVQSSGQWGPQTVGGDTVQVWVDFDAGNVLIKKLGTDASQYQNPIAL